MLLYIVIVYCIMHVVSQPFLAQATLAQAMPKRVRQCANPAVGEADYIECIRSYADKKTVHELLGPLVDEFHRLTPDAVIRSARLLELLIQKGIANGVIYSTRFECAVRATCECPPTRSMDARSAEVTDHIRLCVLPWLGR